MATQVKKGEKRQEGFLYYVKGNNLEVFKVKMARGGKRKKKAKKTTKKKAKKKKGR
ncbi:MAG: hypothetical protein KKG60_03320 [Nanoarchaeota archaeon]|nr:hypothetical protein [Nanoarchaeota archaeon]